MDWNLLNVLRSELLRIKQLNKNATKNITEEDLQRLPGFESWSIEKCREMLSSLRECARVALTFINREKNQENER